MELRTTSRYSDTKQIVWVDLSEISEASIERTSEHNAFVNVTTSIGNEHRLGAEDSLPIYIQDAIEAATLINQLNYFRRSKRGGMTRTLGSWYEFNESPLRHFIGERQSTFAENNRKREAIAEQRKAEAEQRAREIADGMDISMPELAVA